MEIMCRLAALKFSNSSCVILIEMWVTDCVLCRINV